VPFPRSEELWEHRSQEFPLKGPLIYVISLLYICLSHSWRFMLVERQSKRSVHLWQFLKELLMCPTSYQNSIRWLDRHKGLFACRHSKRSFLTPVYVFIFSVLYNRCHIYTSFRLNCGINLRTAINNRIPANHWKTHLLTLFWFVKQYCNNCIGHT